MPACARTMVGLGMFMFDRRGADRLTAGFGTNGDGTVTQRELLAEHPARRQAHVPGHRGPRAVDRESLAQRLELPPGMLQDVFE